jgi:tetratricopeptide (TPR) repeat protein
MKNDLNYADFIERYLDGEMGKDELIWFEKELDSNPQLQKELALRRNVNIAILEKDVMELRSQLKEICSSPVLRETAVRKKAVALRRKLLIAASFITIVVIASFFVLFLGNKSYSNEEIYAMYYRPYEASMNFRSADVNINDELRAAMQYYENKDFRNALVLFEKILGDDPTRIGLNLYSGISHMEVKEYNDANRDFRKIIDDGYSLYIEQAEWYLGFCYLMIGDTEKARQEFGLIAAQDGFYKDKAVKVLDKMK